MIAWNDNICCYFTFIVRVKTSVSKLNPLVNKYFAYFLIKLEVNRDLKGNERTKYLSVLQVRASLINTDSSKQKDH